VAAALMASCKYVISLIKDEHEDDILRELWRSMVVLRNSYLFRASKLRKKRKGKVARKRHNDKSNVKGGGLIYSGGEKVPVTDSNNLPSGSTTSLTLPSSQPVVASNAAAPVSKLPSKEGPAAPPPPSKASEIVIEPTKEGISISNARTWVNIVSPPKMVPPSVVPEPVAKVRPTVGTVHQPPDKTGENGEKEGPPKPIEKSIKKKKERKISSSSSSPSRDPSPKRTAPARQPSRVNVDEKEGRYRQWIREFSRQGCDISQIKKLSLDDDKNLKLYCVWDGRGRGIFTDWESCRRLVDKAPGARYKKVEGTLIEVLTIYKERLV